MVKPFLTTINTINTKFEKALKQLKSDNSKLINLYSNRKDDYMLELLKIVPFLQRHNIFKTLNKNKHRIYFKLDNIIYQIYEYLETGNDPIITPTE